MKLRTELKDGSSTNMSEYRLQTIIFDRAFFLRVPSSVYLLTLALMKAYFPVSSSACNEEEDVSVEIRMSRRKKYIKLVDIV